MIEQYIFNKITADTTLQALLTDGASGYHVYPLVVPRSLIFTKAITFTTIATGDAYPNIKSVTVQFNIFAKTHTDTVLISKALSDLFNEDNNNKDGTNIAVVYSERVSESDLGFDFDETIYHRESSYYFKIR